MSDYQPPTCVHPSVPSGLRSELAAEALQLPGGQSSVREAPAFQRGLCHPALCRQGKKLILKKHCCCVALKSFTGCCTFLCQQVEYQCRGFLEKNRDTLYEELVEVIRVSKVIFSVSLSCAEFPHGSSSFLLLSSGFQSPLLASFFQEEEDQNSANVRGFKVRPARPGMKPANKQLRASVGDKVCTSARCSSGSRSAASKTPLVFCRHVVLPLPLSADGDAERHHAALRPLHQAQ